MKGYQYNSQELSMVRYKNLLCALMSRNAYWQLFGDFGYKKSPIALVAFIYLTLRIKAVFLGIRHITASKLVGLLNDRRSL